MDKVINLGIPHVGEQILENIETEVLIQLCLVSKTWKVLAENVLFKRWRNRFFEACESGKTKIVQLLLELLNDSELYIGLNCTKNDTGDTAFMVACYKGHKGVVKLLLNHSRSKSVNFNARDNNGDTAFIIACCVGHKEDYFWIIQIVKTLI